jgi:membrane-bound metal-dependent hydrolase YbcI (DUF457 family)
MLGKSHLMVGACGWLVAGVPLTELLTGAEMSGAQIASGAVVTAGAAMLPDLDHPQATVSRSLGIVSQKMSFAFSKLMGGHRNGSHSLLFIVAIFLLLNQLLVGNGPAAIIPAFLIIFFLTSLVVRTLTEADGLIGAIVSAIIACTLMSVTANNNSIDYSWIVYSVAIGCLLHDLGDLVTVEGIPLLYPFSKHRTSIPFIGKTDSFREKGTACVCGLAAAWLMFSMVYQPLWDQQKMIGNNSGKQAQANNQSNKLLDKKVVTNKQAKRFNKQDTFIINK